jgi:hypothetical protein
MKRTFVLAVAVVAVCAIGAVAAPTDSANLLQTFRKQLPTIKSKTTVPVLLPRSLPFGDKVPRLFATGTASARGWALDLAGAPGCGRATACFLASFEGRRGGRLPRTANLRLAGGQPALYKGITCGASCSPATLWFTYRGVLYTWQHKDPPAKNTRAALARLAAEAIQAGPR